MSATRSRAWPQSCPPRTARSPEGTPILGVPSFHFPSRHRAPPPLTAWSPLLAWPLGESPRAGREGQIQSRKQPQQRPRARHTLRRCLSEPLRSESARASRTRTHRRSTPGLSRRMRRSPVGTKPARIGLRAPPRLAGSSTPAVATRCQRAAPVWARSLRLRASTGGAGINFEGAEADARQYGSDADREEGCPHDGPRPPSGPSEDHDCQNATHSGVAKGPQQVVSSTVIRLVHDVLRWSHAAIRLPTWVWVHFRPCLVRIPRALRSRAMANKLAPRRVRRPNLGHDCGLQRVGNERPPIRSDATRHLRRPNPLAGYPQAT
jgi:hypothetical protein